MVDLKRSPNTLSDLIRNHGSLYEVYRRYLLGNLPEQETAVVEAELDRNALFVGLACYLRK